MNEIDKTTKLVALYFGLYMQTFTHCKPNHGEKLFQYVLVVLSILFIFDCVRRQDQFAVYIFRFN